MSTIAGRVFPRLRLREGASELLDLPWALPLGEWRPAPDGTIAGMRVRELPVGPSRHLVRFLMSDRRTYALKEEPLGVAGAEFDVLRHLQDRGLPAVTAVGLAEAPDRESAILVTEYLEFSIQYRRLLMRFPLGPGPYRDRLLDAMAWLLVDLHRSGVFWGDCSLANTLFRRDGDRIQAFLVDAETHAWLMPFAMVLLPAGLALFFSTAAAACMVAWRPSASRTRSRSARRIKNGRSKPCRL